MQKHCRLLSPLLRSPHMQTTRNPTCGGLIRVGLGPLCHFSHLELIASTFFYCWVAWSSLVQGRNSPVFFYHLVVFVEELPTMDRLISWGLTVSDACVLCSSHVNLTSISFFSVHMMLLLFGWCSVADLLLLLHLISPQRSWCVWIIMVSLHCRWRLLWSYCLVIVTHFGESVTAESSGVSNTSWGSSSWWWTSKWETGCFLLPQLQMMLALFSGAKLRCIVRVHVHPLLFNFWIFYIIH